MKIHLMILLLLSLALTACGAETVPEETADPPQTVRPAEEPPEDASPDEPEDPASARGIPPLEGTPLTEEELAQVNEAFNAYGKPDGGRRDPGGLRRNYLGGFEEYRLDFIPPGLRRVL